MQHKHGVVKLEGKTRVTIFCLVTSLFLIHSLSKGFLWALGSLHTERLVAQMIHPAATCHAYILSKLRIQQRDGCPLWPSCHLIYLSMNERRWIQPNGSSPLLTGGRGNEVSKRLLEVSQSWSDFDPVTKEITEGQTKRGEARESADAAFVSVWIMMGEWLTE